MKMLGIALSVLICVSLLIHSWIACTVTGILPGYAGSFYWFTLPHLVMAPLAIAVIAVHAKLRTRTSFVSAFICLSCLLPTWFFAGSQWPGGDDGPGMAWVFGVGLSSLLITAIDLPLVYFAHRFYKRSAESGPRE